MNALIDESRVRQIAKLARLDLSNDELRMFAGQLGDIVEYIDQLGAVPTDGVEPLAHPLPSTDVVRDDTSRESFATDTALANAPQTHGSFFRVPTVLDQGTGA